MDIHQLRELVIRPSLQVIDRWSQAAENLLVGVALVESAGGEFVKQKNGPALGIYQCEPATYDYVVKWLKHYKRKQFYNACLSACYYEMPPPADALMYNLRWSTIICRCDFLQVDEPLPNADDIHGLARTWKETYNSRLGKGKVENYVQLYRKHHPDQEL